MPLEDAFKLSRVNQAYLIREAEIAGFKLAGTSEINANPKDTRKENVFFFPPELDPASGNTAKYAALGEADNMLVKLVKPTIAAIARNVGNVSRTARSPESKNPRNLAVPGVFPFRTLAVTYSGMPERHTTIGAERFHFRVRNGIGWFPLAIATRETV